MSDDTLMYILLSVIFVTLVATSSIFYAYQNKIDGNNIKSLCSQLHTATTKYTKCLETNDLSTIIKEVRPVNE